jgi:hypothetical protein
VSTPHPAAPPTTASPAPARRDDRSSRAPGGCQCHSARRRSPAPHAARGSARSPRIARHLQRDPVARIETPREQLKRLRCGRDPPRRRSRPSSARIATSQKSRCTSSATALTSSSSLSATNGRTGGQTTSTDPRSQRNRASRRGGHRNCRSRSPSSKTARQTCVLPESPLSQSAEPKPAAGHHQGPRENSFMPRDRRRTMLASRTAGFRAKRKLVRAGALARPPWVKEVIPRIHA